MELVVEAGRDRRELDYVILNFMREEILRIAWKTILIRKTAREIDPSRC